MEKIFAGRKVGFDYTRISNPTTTIFERRLADLNVVESGDEIISSGSLFGGTSNFFRELKSFGVCVRYVKENRAENFADLLTNHTKLIYAEMIGNPRLDVTDICALVELAHENNLPLCIDSTVTTPYLVRPIELARML